MRKRMAVGSIVGLALMVTAACSKKETPPPSAPSEPATAAAKVTEPKAPVATPEAPPAAPVKAGGEIKYQVLPPKTPAFATYQKTIFQHPRLDGVTKIFNTVLDFPRDVQVTVKECGMLNAFYMKKDHSVTLCYELADYFYKGFLSLHVTPAQALDKTLNAFTFVTIHELGHAVIGELDLGVTGGEDQAVDELATLFLTILKQPAMAEDGALAMLMLGKLSKKPQYFDEHPVGEQRFYNILCLILGSDPPTYSKKYVPRYLPAARAVRCADEFEKRKKGWDKMVEPFEKKH